MTEKKFHKNLPDIYIHLPHIKKQANWTKCLKNQSCDVIKKREVKGEVGKKTQKKEMDNPSFNDVTWLIF